MEQGNSSVSIDKTRVLDVMPLRCLVPIFPNATGMSSMSNPQPSHFVCVPPSGPFPPGVLPFYPFLAPNVTQNQTTPRPQQNPSANFGYGSSIPAPIPLNTYRSPMPQENGGSTSRVKRASKTRASRCTPMENDGGFMDSEGDRYADGNSTGGSLKLPARRTGRKRAAENPIRVDVESLVEELLTSFKLKDIEEFRKLNGEKSTISTVLLLYDLLKRKMTRLEELNELAPGTNRRPDLKAGTLLMSKGLKANTSKRVGHIPGIEVGDIFFFRMELCIVGIHAPTMAGIDYISVKVSVDEEPMAVCVVSSGGYNDDDMGDPNVLVYSGQGGVQRRDGQMFDQKLERGNLALEKSLHRGNDVRVIRGINDIIGTGKTYVYDGLYKIRESWRENNVSGCNVFKYKLVREPGQPEAFSLWKSIQNWKVGTTARPGIVLPDLSSGVEGLQVALVNEVDNEKGPSHFTYISTLKYSKPFSSDRPTLGCQCVKGCDITCGCCERNDGCLPYSPLGVLLTDKSVIYECGPECTCPLSCRNRLTQAGLKVRLEVFKTQNRGWGLRSWDPIRAGGFICEYAGEAYSSDEFLNGGDYFLDTTRYFEPFGGIPSENEKSAPFPLVISADNFGNVARFMNHSCSPNVFWKPILRENESESYLHIAFFATRHIPPLQELTIDYGVPEIGDKGKKTCMCGSAACKGHFY